MIQIMVFDFWKRLYKIMKCQYATKEREKRSGGKGDARHSAAVDWLWERSGANRKYD